MLRQLRKKIEFPKKQFEVNYRAGQTELTTKIPFRIKDGFDLALVACESDTKGVSCDLNQSGAGTAELLLHIDLANLVEDTFTVRIWDKKKRSGISSLVFTLVDSGKFRLVPSIIERGVPKQRFSLFRDAGLETDKLRVLVDGEEVDVKFQRLSSKVLHFVIDFSSMQDPQKLEVVSDNALEVAEATSVSDSQG